MAVPASKPTDTPGFSNCDPSIFQVLEAFADVANLRKKCPLFDQMTPVSYQIISHDSVEHVVFW